MKIIVFKWKPLLFSGAAAAILVSLFCFAATPKLISAFSSSNGRSLPIYSVQTEEQEIALGFNCAWDDADIPSLLSTLDTCDVKATFFLLGEWACKYPDTQNPIALSGNEIGSPSNTHRDMDTLSSERFAARSTTPATTSTLPAVRLLSCFVRLPALTMIWSSTPSINAVASRFNGASTRWTGRVWIQNRWSHGCSNSSLQERFSCCMQAHSIPHKRCHNCCKPSRMPAILPFP